MKPFKNVGVTIVLLAVAAVALLPETQAADTCTAAGYFTSCCRPGGYYYCIYSGGRWLMYELSCAAGYEYNQAQQKCVAAAATTTTKPTTTTTKPTTTTTKPTTTTTKATTTTTPTTTTTTVAPPTTTPAAPEPTTTVAAATGSTDGAATSEASSEASSAASSEVPPSTTETACYDTCSAAGNFKSKCDPRGWYKCIWDAGTNRWLLYALQCAEGYEYDEAQQQCVPMASG